jgi:hypothetical protein
MFNNILEPLKMLLPTVRPGNLCTKAIIFDQFLPLKYFPSLFILSI